MARPIKCVHQWIGGMMVVHPEELDQVAAVRKVVCSMCDHRYDPKESEYTVIFDWSAESWSADDAIPVVVLATQAGQAQDRAQELLLATKHDWTEDDFNWVITFNGDVTGLVAE